MVASGTSTRLGHVLGEHQPPRDHVVCDVADRALVSESVGPQANERVLRRHAELGQDHAGGLVHLGTVAVQSVPPRPVLPASLPALPIAVPSIGGRSRGHLEQQQGRRVGRGDDVAEFVPA